ncbi:PHD finger protein 7-like [Catharus ustulatus]|uniref:PHD finger protein 7-like n=1 Tax=Catharus ustulatus TaxID=91951 RepID=UPI001C5B90D1|nr:PHD finger protein 7-like [Catharus ustulatus]
MAPALQGLQPCPSGRQGQGQSSPWGRCCRLRALQRCSCPVPLALSPAACVLCHRTEADPDICGDKLEKFGLCAHVFCLYFATLLPQRGSERAGLMGFLPRDIRLAVRVGPPSCAARKTAANGSTCPVPRRAAVSMNTSPHTGTSSSFLATPGEESNNSHFAHPFSHSSFCSEHRPHQDLQVTPEPGTECPICMEPVEDRMSYRTMVCPACKRAWFHRDCIQGQAMRAGLLCFQCPLCRDSEEFILQMIIMGIRVPFRLPTWEDNDAFADLGERHSQCNARECLYPGGREEAEEEGPWKLLLCSSCAAEGTHRRCSGLGNHIDSWECDSCAGLGTGMRQSTWVSLVWGQCPGWAWQRLSAPGGMWAQLLPGLPWAWGASDIPVCPSRLQG